MNEIADMMSAECRHGIHLWPRLLDLSVLMFADDLMFVSSTLAALKNQINCLANWTVSTPSQLLYENYQILVLSDKIIHGPYTKASVSIII